MNDFNSFETVAEISIAIIGFAGVITVLGRSGLSETESRWRLIMLFLDGATALWGCLTPVLAVGAELKNTICLTKENRAFLSQHIGDMENVETLDFFHLTISHLKRILEIRPKILAHDLHPDYLSSKFARKQDALPTIAVQHHQRTTRD